MEGGASDASIKIEVEQMEYFKFLSFPYRLLSH